MTARSKPRQAGGGSNAGSKAPPKRGTIKYFHFYPTQKDADMAGAPSVGLRFDYDPRLATLLETLNTDYRAAHGSGVLRYSDAARCWIIDPDGEPYIFSLLRRFYALRKVHTPVDVPEFYPRREAEHGDREPINTPDLSTVIASLQVFGYRLAVRNGKLGIVTPPGHTASRYVTEMVTKYREPLQWLITTGIEYEPPQPRGVPATPVGVTTDPYAVLGVAHTCTVDELQRSYRAAIKGVHPDRFPSDIDPEIRQLAESKSKAINLAFTTLKQRVRT